MITIKLNIKPVTDLIEEKIKRLSDKEYLLRPVAFDMIELMTKRIHNEGKASDGAPIGTYSKGYLKLRQEKYKRFSDSKVIISLTTQLENGWSVIATQKGYGVGFLNIHNYDKAQWVEATYAKKIFDLTKAEKEHAITRINELVTAALQ